MRGNITTFHSRQNNVTRQHEKTITNGHHISPWTRILGEGWKAFLTKVKRHLPTRVDAAQVDKGLAQGGDVQGVGADGDGIRSIVEEKCNRPLALNLVRYVISGVDEPT